MSDNIRLRGAMAGVQVNVGPSYGRITVPPSGPVTPALWCSFWSTLADGYREDALNRRLAARSLLASHAFRQSCLCDAYALDRMVDVCLANLTGWASR